MRPLSRGASAALLDLAAQVQDWDADLGDEVCSDRLQAVLLALGHALVDLADGAEAPTIATPWPAPMRGTRRATPPAIDRAECSALGASMTSVRARIADLAPARALTPRLLAATAQVRSGLQQHAQDPTPPGSGLGFGQDLSRRLRRAHLWVQPAGTTQRSQA